MRLSGRPIHTSFSRFFFRRFGLVGTLAAVVSLALTTFEAADVPPAGALKTMQVPPGFSVQLFAAEPLVMNPTNLDIDARGRVWVTESHNYDASPEEFDQKGDKVVILEDQNGDGRADTRRVFFEHPGLNAPMGLTLAEHQVILAQAPYLLVLHDLDHDDRADKIDTLFSGFGKRDHGIHPPFWGPDGKLYFSMGNYGGELSDKNGNPLRDRAGNRITGKNGSPADGHRDDGGHRGYGHRGYGQPYRNGLIVRCNADGSGLEVLGHNFRNQFEPTIDSYGNLWTSDNDDDGNASCRITQVMEYGNYGFADERTGAAWTTYRTNLEKTVPERHWHQNDPGVVPNVLITGAGSPAGLTIYEGTLFPAPYRSQLLHAEALHNVVRFYPYQKKGAGYTARLANLLRSSDQWVRPVDVSVAPDGSVLVADWYDPGIGGGTAADARKGRIYRVTYGAAKAYRSPRIDVTTPAGAAEALKSPNRYVQRLAFDKLRGFGPAAEPALLKLYAAANPVWQARALWLLTKLPGKETDYLQKALTSANPDLRLVGIRAARQTAGVKLARLLLPLAADPDPMVRREVAVALRFDGSPEASQLWASLARQHDGTDRFYLEALGIGADRYADARLDAYLKAVGDDWNTPGGRDILWRSRAEKALPCLADIIRAQTDPATTYRYFRAFDYHDGPVKQQELLALVDSPDAGVQRLALQHMNPADVQLTPALKAALARAMQASVGTPEYIELAQKFNRSGAPERHQCEALLDLVRQHPAGQLGKDALALLWQWQQQPLLKHAMADDRTARAVLDAFNGDGRTDVLTFANGFIWDDAQPLEVRKAAVRAVGSSWAGETYLLEQVRQATFPDALKPAAASVLFGAYRNTIKREAERYLPKPAGRNGETLPPVYLLAYERGNAAAGKTVFQTNCTACHRVQQQGVQFGPELTQIGAKLSREGLFRAILYPNEGVNHGYETYQVQTRDKATYVGLIGSETSAELTLKLPGGLTQTIRQSAVTSRTKLDDSLMPAFGEALSKRELVDLVQYLEGLK